MTADDYPLQEIPDRLFYPEAWAALKAEYAVWSRLTGTTDPETRLLESLRPDPSSHNEVDREASRESLNPVLRSQNRVADMRDQLIGPVRDKLRAGVLVATGRVPPNPATVTIPADLWDVLVLDIPYGTAKGGGYAFQDVRVGASAPPIPMAASRYRDWMQNLPPETKARTKKEIQSLAEKEFGPAFKVRDFDVAYGEVFRKKRGRPPKNAAIKTK